MADNLKSRKKNWHLYKKKSQKAFDQKTLTYVEASSCCVDQLCLSNDPRR